MPSQKPIRHLPKGRAAALAAASFLICACSRTELVNVTDTRLSGPLREASVPVRLDVAWKHSFRNAVNWDAAWVLLKFRVEDGPWQHATISTDELETAVGNDHGTAAIVTPSSDGRGAFIYRAGAGEGGVNWDEVQLRWHYAQDGVADGSDVSVHAVGIEMVYVPGGPFSVGDAEAGDVRGHFRGPTGALAYDITNEGAIPLGGTAANRMSSNNSYGMDPGFPDDFTASMSAILPQAFPKGFAPFYIMKYELTQGTYASFMKLLDDEQRSRRNPATTGQRPRPGLDRYTVSANAPFIASVPDRAAHYLSWMDGAAVADWAALRPMTELEFEKAARGTAPSSPGEFAWGNSNIHTGRYALTYIDTPQERVNNIADDAGNAAYAVTMGPGPEAGCWSCLSGPLGARVFSSAGASREQSGSSYYGVLHLSGNLFERVVSIGNAAGRRFDGSHGDGLLNPAGNASGPEIARWPGSSNTGPTSQVIGSVGTGFRGGSWASPAANLRVSDREFSATPDNFRQPTFGYRFVRTAPPLQ